MTSAPDYYLAKNRKQHSPEFYSEDLIGVAGNADRGERKGEVLAERADRTEKLGAGRHSHLLF